MTFNQVYRIQGPDGVWCWLRHLRRRVSVMASHLIRDIALSGAQTRGWFVISLDDVISLYTYFTSTEVFSVLLCVENTNNTCPWESFTLPLSVSCLLVKCGEEWGNRNNNREYWSDVCCAWDLRDGDVICGWVSVGDKWGYQRWHGDWVAESSGQSEAVCQNTDQSGGAMVGGDQWWSVGPFVMVISVMTGGRWMGQWNLITNYITWHE